MPLVGVVQQHQQAVPPGSKQFQGQTVSGMGTTRMLPLGLLQLPPPRQRLLSRGMVETLGESLRQQNLLQVQLLFVMLCPLSLLMCSNGRVDSGCRLVPTKTSNRAGRYTLAGETQSVYHCNSIGTALVPGQQGSSNLARVLWGKTDL